MSLAEKLGLRTSLKKKIKFYYSNLKIKFDELYKKHSAIKELP